MIVATLREVEDIRQEAPPDSRVQGTAFPGQ